jgi:hypothetical protein
MDLQVFVKRRTVPISFSRDLEALLLATNTEHISLTHDLELAAQKGVDMLADLEDVRDIKHTDSLQTLIDKTNIFSKTDSDYFKTWHIDIADDLLDEIDLVLLAHKEDLIDMGLENVTHGTLLVLLALAALTNNLL